MKHQVHGLIPFPQFPKQRPILPEAHKARYTQDYQDNRQGKTATLAKKLEAWMHRQISATGDGNRVLEIGAGTLNHLAYEERHEVYDAIEPFRELWEGSPNLGKLRTLYPDIRNVVATERYDRILSVAVLEHLTELPYVVARSCLLLSPGGTFAAGIPSEGSLSWYLAWRYGTGIPYRLRTGLDYGPLMRHEHVNKAPEIEEVLRYFFRNVKRNRFPTPLFHASFYTVLVANDPDLAVSERYCRLYEQQSS